MGVWQQWGILAGLSVVPVLVAVPARGAPVPGPTADKVVTLVQKLYDGTKDFQAEFDQEYVMAALSRSQRSTGRVAYQRPGRIRFDYLTPQPKTFAVEGTTLWVYQPEDQQALVDRCFKNDAMAASLVFLGGAGRIADQFDTSLEAGEETAHALRLTPKKPTSAFKSIVLWVDKKTGEVRRSDVEDPSGNPNRFTFKAVRRNKGLKDDAARFTPPPGTAVNPMPGSCPSP
jgi:outer membrane lipoprotein carrier protein